jgi:hypothetical protein
MRIAIFLLAALPACGQHLSFGILGGGIATGGLDPAADNTWDGKRYTVGIGVEVKLPLPRLSLEVDALFQHAGQRASDCALTSCSYSEVRADIFEFPALLKYRPLRHAPVAPFLETGAAAQWVRRGSGTLLTWRTGPLVPGETVDLSVHHTSVSMPAENHAGVVAGGGVELRAGPLRIAPEVRYTRWLSPYWESAGPRGFFTASNQNEVTGMVGVRF